MDENLSLSIEQKESIKLMKMSKGFQWEIKIILADDDDKSLKRLDKLNDYLQNKYGETFT